MWLLEYLKAFLCGGTICIVGQLLIDKTKLSPARILVIFVISGVTLTALGIYDPFVNFAGAGATVPLLGFGNALAGGVAESVAEEGLMGAISGGLKAVAPGICAAILFAYLAALLSKPKSK